MSLAGLRFFLWMRGRWRGAWGHAWGCVHPPPALRAASKEPGRQQGARTQQVQTGSRRGPGTSQSGRWQPFTPSPSATRLLIVLVLLQVSAGKQVEGRPPQAGGQQSLTPSAAEKSSQPFWKLLGGHYSATLHPRYLPRSDRSRCKEAAKERRAAAPVCA